MAKQPAQALPAVHRPPPARGPERVGWMLLALSILTSPLSGQTAEDAPTISRSGAPTESEAQDPPDGSGETPDPQKEAAAQDDDTCHLPPSGDWLDNLRRNVYRSVCGSSLWFDHFFGARRIENERHDTYGWFGSSLSWDDWDGVEPRVRLRAKIALPRINHRLNAVIGRDDPEAFFDEESDEQRTIPDPFLETDEEWLTGLEYRGVHGDKHDLDYGLGLDLGFPMDPYVRIRYRFQDFLGERWFFRFRVTPFWRNSERAGGSTRIEFDNAISHDMLLRFYGSALWSERSEGVEWRTGPTLYRRLSDRRAIALRLLAWGETDDEVPLRGYGPEVTYRQRVWKDWLYLELETRVAARREAPGVAREWVPRVGFGFEMRFGEREGNL